MVGPAIVVGQSSQIRHCRIRHTVVLADPFCLGEPPLASWRPVSDTRGVENWLLKSSSSHKSHRKFIFVLPQSARCHIVALVDADDVSLGRRQRSAARAPRGRSPSGSGFAGANLVEGHGLERVGGILGSLKLCRARVTKEAACGGERYTKPMRGGSRDKGRRLETSFKSVEPRPRDATLGEMNAMGGTGRGFQVTLAAATDSRDAQTPESGPKVETRTANRQRGWLTRKRREAPKRQHSYSGGESFEGETP